MMSLLFAIWSIIVCHMKSGVCLKWTLWKRTESPLLTFEIEPTRHWTSWDEKWDEDGQADNDKPETINGWDQHPGWDEIVTFNEENLNPKNPLIQRTPILTDGMLKNGTSNNKI